ncbi:MAG: carbohydrate kinase family protein [Candidatus Woesearchaeota archaeon]
MVDGKKTLVEDESLVYPIGEKIIIDHLDFQIGGGGTNTAVAFSRLGFKTGYLGKIGHDDNGLKVYNLLKEEKIEFLGAVGDKTGFSVILDSMMDDRTILTYKGCSNDLSVEDVDFSKLKSTWFYFSSMMEESLKTSFELAKFIKKSGAKLAFNPSLYITKLGLNALKPILKVTDILVFNKEESETLTGLDDQIEIFKVLKKSIRGIVIITDGKNGVSLYDGSNIYFATPTPNLNIVETTGAGDSFAAGFTAGFMLKKSIKDSMKMGLLQSEAVIQEYGAKSNLLNSNELNDLLSKDKRIVSVKKLR